MANTRHGNVLIDKLQHQLTAKPILGRNSGTFNAANPATKTAVKGPPLQQYYCTLHGRNFSHASEDCNDVRMRRSSGADNDAAMLVTSIPTPSQDGGADSQQIILASLREFRELLLRQVPQQQNLVQNHHPSVSSPTVAATFLPPARKGGYARPNVSPCSDCGNILHATDDCWATHPLLAVQVGEPEWRPATHDMARWLTRVKQLRCEVAVHLSPIPSPPASGPPVPENAVWRMADPGDASATCVVMHADEECDWVALSEDASSDEWMTDEEEGEPTVCVGQGPLPWGFKQRIDALTDNASARAHVDVPTARLLAEPESLMSLIVPKHAVRMGVDPSDASAACVVMQVDGECDTIRMPEGVLSDEWVSAYKEGEPTACVGQDPLPQGSEHCLDALANSSRVNTQVHVPASSLLARPESLMSLAVIFLWKPMRPYYTPS